MSTIICNNAKKKKNATMLGLIFCPRIKICTAHAPSWVSNEYMKGNDVKCGTCLICQ